MDILLLQDDLFYLFFRNKQVHDCYLENNNILNNLVLYNIYFFFMKNIKIYPYLIYFILQNIYNNQQIILNNLQKLINYFMGKQQKGFNKYSKQGGSSNFDELMRGFVLMCDRDREKNAVKDAYNFLVNLIEQHYPDIQQKVQNKKVKLNENEEIKINTNDILDQELNELKQQKNKLLYNVNTDVKCTVFLKINSQQMDLVDVNQITEILMNKVHIQKEIVTRFRHRIYPAQYAFRAEQSSLDKYIQKLSQEKIPLDTPSSWMIVCKIRNNNKFNKKNILETVQKYMPHIHFVDYKSPFFTILVDVSHNLMCLSVLKNYLDWKKYSLKTNPDQSQVLKLNQKHEER
ncbi:hypothetical protein IMG5_100230 [Ichthyophthirius multifiliis]|uniref:THUMP domain-containing protein n=1 Tax=Ichthyophthirius multifiliis TaxID=5932 RepID=G0QSC7_ICHMU|nr:hypothetical protein IMG5_100230 [Ichthyophthirius multifiliis]EGR31874.1 hypothetical protein IMG5_100230 [Ichthyophthirius multifiliis]|eukprot:XP_004035360.1 hypothetical protein IMG5_100230 [Ichthyophthirius multifiliis]